MLRKRCKRCGRRLPASDFYAHPRMGDGLLSFCKTCTKARVKAHRLANIQAARDYDARRYRENPARRAQTRAQGEEWAERYPERRRAHDLVRKAIRAGRMARGPCEVGAGCSGPVHAHHDDYSRPLDVRWLCAAHHAQHHASA